MSLIAEKLPIVISVDDSQVVQQLIKRALEAEYKVLLCSNAIQALSLMDREPVALLLLDILMPEIDGLDLCRTIRSIPKFQNLPIVMLTARDGNLDKIQGRLAGATDYLTKPFDAQQLRQIVRNVIAINTGEESDAGIVKKAN